MITKAIILFFALFAISWSFSYAQSPLPSPTVAPTSFDLFWPVSAGKVSGEPLYFLKTLKENVRGMLIFSDFKKAEYVITLSEKRTAEFEKLALEKKDYPNASLTLDRLEANIDTATSLVASASDNPEVGNLQNKLNSTLEKQLVLLQYIRPQMPENEHSKINETISFLSGKVQAN